MYTSLVLVALTGTFIEGDAASGASPTWYGDYAIARKEGAEAHKPLAVFVGKGEAGYGSVAYKGKLPKEVLKLLEDRYICVYLDTNTPSGQKAAASFKLAGPGFVLSDGTGESQAFHHKGEIPLRDMKRYLKKYADPEREVTQTEVHIKPVVRVASAMTPQSAVSGSC